MIKIRPAISSDSATLSKLAEKTFRETFSHENTIDDMDDYCANNYSEAIQSSELANSGYYTFVAENEQIEENKKLVAYTQIKWDSIPSNMELEHPAEIKRIYIEKHYHGKGLAQKLMFQCLSKMKENNVQTAWLGVWENNFRAITFYKKTGFTEIGEHIFTLGKDKQRDIILALNLEEWEQQR
ncbi:GNAT family N-acetyltransferase [Aliikangiella sp. G2MR2-5]|uniref:GNAT family N-acetyltransferase n=1 Tax=Aliikangiella sp. G2MR2-5 TaxID=2788943 RepID=UPI0018AB99DC|nr:GNAT family N-acetyltransferase [Aliikangiella sp. G2MR2-5]